MVLQHLNGEMRLEVLDPVFEQLRPKAPGSEFSDFITPRGPIRLCPVEVFRLLRACAVSAGKLHVA